MVRLCLKTNEARRKASSPGLISRIWDEKGLDQKSAKDYRQEQVIINDELSYK